MTVTNRYARKRIANMSIDMSVKRRYTAKEEQDPRLATPADAS